MNLFMVLAHLIPKQEKNNIYKKKQETKRSQPYF